ncbi:putative RNA-directed DNA polymerase from transposon BS [Trichonephila clavipes]|nr:putative RNA-directed DNA polymerase from transposon BS [Trichonephila clavipes]
MSWKTAVVIPILKPDKNSALAESYRPISLLPVLSKLAEKVILARLNDHLERENILIPEQHGFRPRLSTSHQLLRVVEFIKEGNNKDECTAAVFLDIQKAFDRSNFVELQMLSDWLFPYITLAELLLGQSDHLLFYFLTWIKNQDHFPALSGLGTPSSSSTIFYLRDFEVKNCYESSGRDWSARSAPIGGERVCRKRMVCVLHQNCCVVRVKADSREACSRDIIDVDVK